jgi:hypothetical protein
MKNTVFSLLIGLCFPLLAHSDTTSFEDSTVTPQLAAYVVPPPEVVAEREVEKHARASRVHRSDARSNASSAHQDRVNNHENAANTRQDDRQEASNNHQANQQDRANNRQR